MMKAQEQAAKAQEQVAKAKAQVKVKAKSITKEQLMELCKQLIRRPKDLELNPLYQITHRFVYNDRVHDEDIQDLTILCQKKCLLSIRFDRLCEEKKFIPLTRTCIRNGLLAQLNKHYPLIATLFKYENSILDDYETCRLWDCHFTLESQNMILHMLNLPEDECERRMPKFVKIYEKYLLEFMYETFKPIILADLRRLNSFNEPQNILIYNAIVQMLEDNYPKSFHQNQITH